MASYTMLLKDYVEQASQNEELSTRDRIKKGQKKLFDFEYPIFDESYRNVFETHFIRNFYMREIGFETEGLFKFQLETWLLINMPYFNKLFESEMLTFDPLINSEMNTTYNKTQDKTQNDSRDKTSKTSEKGKNDVTNNQTSNTTGTTHSDSDTDYTDKQTGKTDTTGEKLNSDFSRDMTNTNPDTRLAITTNDGKGVIEYASSITEKTNKDNETSEVNTTDSKDTTGSNTNITDTTSDIDNTSEMIENETSERDRDVTENDKLISDINEIEDFVQHRVGKTGSQTYSKMLQEYRQSFLRIEKQIFKEMQQLFMLVY